MSNAGRKGTQFEEDMQEYRQYFKRGKERTIHKKAIKLKAYCEWAKTTPQQLIDAYAEARKSLNTLQDWKREQYTKIVEFYNYLN